MRHALLAALVISSACIMVERPAPVSRTYAPAATPAAAPSPPLAPGRPTGGLTEPEAVAKAFDYARDRGLEVNRVTHAHLDAKGRWHVEVRGAGDRAKMLIDVRDGRLLKGRFRESDADVED
jgi:hypothetical protein